MEAPPKHPQTAAMFAALLKALDVSASKLAANISTEAEKYSQQTIANYVAGKFKPGQELLAAISRRYPAISPAWLLTGQGEMFPTGRFNERAATPEAQIPPLPTIKREHLTPTAGAGYLFVSHSLERMLAGMTDAQRADFWQGRYEEEVLSHQKTETDLLDRLVGKTEASADTAAPTPAPALDIFGYPTTRPEEVYGLVRYDWQSNTHRAHLDLFTGRPVEEASVERKEAA